MVKPCHVSVEGLASSALNVPSRAGFPSSRKSAGKPPLGESNWTVVPDTVSSPKCGGACARVLMALSGAVPNELTPALSHSRPTRVSHPSGAASSCSRWARHASTSLRHCASPSAAPSGEVCDRQEPSVKRTDAMTAQVRRGLDFKWILRREMEFPLLCSAGEAAYELRKA